VRLKKGCENFDDRTACIRHRQKATVPVDVLCRKTWKTQEVHFDRSMTKSRVAAVMLRGQVSKFDGNFRREDWKREQAIQPCSWYAVGVSELPEK
jgi:hypothetical protein